MLWDSAIYLETKESDDAKDGTPYTKTEKTQL